MTVPVVRDPEEYTTMLFFRGRTPKRRDSSSSTQPKREQAPFAASTRIARACMEVLEERQLLANPVLDPIPDARVPGGKSLIIPLTATDEDGDRLTYSVSSDNDDIDVRMSKSTTWVSMTVSSTGSAGTISGEMVFQLFGDFAPETVRSFVNLVKSEFYDGNTFHRLADLDSNTTDTRTSWILQGGQKGTPQFKLDDEYHRDGIFSGKGQLAMAKSTGDDNATTQFFITQSPTRFLDSDYPMFGQMVRGFGVLEEITEKLRPGTGSETPAQTITMTNVRIVKNKTDGVLIIRAPQGEVGTVSVRVNDGTSNDRQTFDVRGVRDETNGVANNAEPYLVRPLKDQIIAPTQYFDVKLGAFDLEGDTKLFAAQSVGFTGNSLHALVENDVLRIVPDAGFRGPLVYDIWTYRSGGSAAQSAAMDTQRVVFMVGEHPISDVEPQQFDGEVGVEKQDVLLTFRDTNPNGQAGDFAARVNWGDGTVTDGVISESDGVFRVRGTHNYAVAGTYKAVVTIESNLNAAAATSAGGRKGVLRKVVTNAVVADGALTGVEKVIIGDAGVALSGVVVAEFKSGDARDVATDFDVEIRWGDGTVHHSDNTADNVGRTGLGGGSFRITGTKPGGYANADAYVVTVTVTDRESGESVVIQSEAFIDRADFNVGSITDTGSLDEGVADNFQDDDVTFTDSEAGHTYTGKVNWGEGDADDFEDLVVDSAAKTFDLKHTYKESGTYQITVVITDENGDTATRQLSVTVANKPPTVGTLSGQGSAVRGEKVTIKWRDVVDLSEKDTDAVFQYEIDWGDGNKETVADFDKDNRRTTASHVYEKVSFTTDGTVKDTFTVKIRAIDKDMNGVPLSSDTGKSYEIDVKAIELRVDPDVPAISHLYVGGIAQGSADADIETIKVVPHGDGTPGKVVVTIDNKDTANDLTETHTIPAGGRIIVFGGGDGSSDGNGKDVLIIKAGLTNDAELYGGTGNDKLVGAAGNDVLAGGTGNDTLVGEAGNDVIFDGGAADPGVSATAVDIIQAGDGEDLIFSGTTRDVRKLGVVVVYDNDPASLRAISAEWTRSDISYADRLDHLTGKTTGGLNGRVVLSDENVSDDFRRDQINGEGGRDAFFYGNNTQVAGIADVLKDREKGERGIAHS
jgi:cyclophilin family peptidyl-prolyl cis-trans isomerase